MIQRLFPFMYSTPIPAPRSDREALLYDRAALWDVIGEFPWEQ